MVLPMFEGKCSLIASGVLVLLACGRQERGEPVATTSPPPPVVQPDPGCTQCNGTWSHPFMLSRVYAQLAYDSARERVVMFGGTSGFGFGPGGALHETWEWDGTTWSQLQPEHEATGAAYGTMAYDAAHRQLLQFGGASDSASLPNNETWLWSGADWSRLQPQHSPPPRVSAWMLFDAKRQTLVLAGGYARDGDGQTTRLMDTWEWNGTDWLERQPEHHPDGQGLSAVYDARRGRVIWLVLTSGLEVWSYDGSDWTLEGRDDSWPSVIDDAQTLIYDPWLERPVLVTMPGYHASAGWDGSRWSLIPAPDSSPLGRGVAVVNDEARHQLVAFGGNEWDSERNATYTYDGTQWHLVGPSRPTISPYAVVVFDEARARTLLTDYESFYPDRLAIWSWEGESWQRVNYRQPLPARAYEGISYDPMRDEVVVFGGEGLGDAETVAETWVFDGLDWLQVGTDHRPAAREDARMVYDRARQVTLLYGGETVNPLDHIDDDTILDDLWQWDGLSWVEQKSAVMPPPRIWAAFGYDAAREQAVLVGGYGRLDDGSVGLRSDTWTWDGVAWTERSPAHVPEARENAGLVFDPVRKRLMLIGGLCADTCQGWEWNGEDWSPFDQPPLAPGVDFRWTFDVARRQAVGVPAASLHLSQDVWLYTPDGGR